jgi:hypothetical protein
MKLIRWSYKVIRITEKTKELDDLCQALDAVGEKGWELVGVFSIPNLGDGIIILKKPKALV